MPNNIDKQLIELMNSLEKSEKRHFKLYSNRNYSGKKGLNYVHLFDVIDRSGLIDRTLLEKRIPNITGRQLSDLKAQLYRHLLKSLRMLHTKQSRIELREMLDHAQILYKKGLFIQSLQLIAKTKSKAWHREEHLIVQECIDFEKRIEARHVTRSHEKRAKELSAELRRVRRVIRAEEAWSDLMLELYSRFLKTGHVKSQVEQESLKQLFQKRSPSRSTSQAPRFFETLYRLMSMVWYHYILQDFVKSYRYSMQWVQLCEAQPEMSNLDPKIIIKGYHNCLSNLFYCLDSRRHRRILTQMETYLVAHMESLDENARQMSFTYYSMAELNAIILEGNFSESRTYLRALESKLKEPSNQVDQHRMMVFWYKIGSIYFTMGDTKQCIVFLNKIINSNQQHLREDVQCFARILNLVAHFEMGNAELIPYHFRSVYRFLLKMKELQSVQATILAFIRKSIDLNSRELNRAFIKLREDLIIIRKDPYENRAFLYLDIISWLTSHIEGVPVEEIIKKERSILQ